MSKLDKLNRFMYFIFKNYNFIQQSKFIFEIKKRRLISKNEHLTRNTEECFILGNGPSLRDFDLELLDNYDTFTVNYFHKGKQSTNFKSTYHVMVDSAFYTPDYLEYLLEIFRKESGTNFIFSTKGFIPIANREANLERAYFINQGLIQYGDYVRLNLTKNVTASVNVVLAAIQTAIYLGYKQIYLIGCDFNSYATMKPSHYYSSDLANRTVPMGVDLQWSSLAHYHHYALEKYASRHNVKIFNATPNSLIDAYERISINEILNK